jgi:pimeloyl-ACP methyl ester carboxylesterase
LTPFLLLGIAVLAAALVAAVWVLPIILQHLGGSSGGWSRLATAYATKEPRPQKVLNRQNIVTGRVLWRFCVTVGASPAGLCLEAVPPIPVPRRPPLLIPWSEFKRLEQARLFWRSAARFSLGDPLVGTVTLPMHLYAMAQPFLPATLGKGLPPVVHPVHA